MSFFKVFCNECGIKTNHSVLHEAVNNIYQNEGADESYLDFVETFQIVKCENCNDKSYRSQYDYGFAGDAGPVISTSHYPARKEDGFQEKKYNDMPRNINEAYLEVIGAYNFNLPILCASGLRTLVEGLCTHFQVAEKDSSGKSVPLGSRIRDLSVKRLISNSLADALRAHKELGNDAVHNLVAPSKEELKLAIGLIETSFENLFNVAKNHHELGDRMTRRIVGG